MLTEPLTPSEVAALESLKPDPAQIDQIIAAAQAEDELTLDEFIGRKQ
jgi:hypothetical protein